ncbi:MAG: MFS transporter [Gemmatimonadetes bacterium]|nr:MAG: MFS transporter [Gemmatimonadota bacterium]
MRGREAAPAARLPRPVKLFGAVSLLNDFASEMIYPLLPAFVTGVLGAGPQALGALDGAAELAASVVKFGAGRLADRPARRGPLIVLGYAIAVLVRPIIALTAAAWQVIGLRVVDRIGKGIRTPPRDALMADVTPTPLLGRAFGLQRGMDHAGAVLGPLVAWSLLATRSADVRAVIALSLAPGVAVLVLAVWAVKGGAARGGNGRQEAAQAAVPMPPVAARYRPLPPALFVISLFYLLRMPETLMILRSQQLGVSTAAVLLLWAALHVVRSSASFAGGRLTDRIGASRTMWLGWLSYAAIAAGFAVATGAGRAWALFLAFGIVAGLTESPERALVAQFAGGHQGSGFGLYHGVTGLAALAGGIGLGAVFQAYGAGTAFLGSAVGGLALVLGWPVVTLRRSS